MLEVGSYCGRSTIWLGDAAERSGVVLFAVDHHRGSEENQAGWDHHDVEVVDARIGKMDTLPFFRAAIHDAELEDSVIAVVGKSPLVACHVDHAAVVPLHRRRPRRGTRSTRLRRAGRRTSRSAARWRSTTCSRTPPTAGARRTSRSSSRRSSRVGSSWCRRPGRYACCVESTDARACDQAPYWRTTTNRCRSTYSNRNAPTDITAAAANPRVDLRSGGQQACHP